MRTPRILVLSVLVIGLWLAVGCAAPPAAAPTSAGSPSSPVSAGSTSGQKATSTPFASPPAVAISTPAQAPAQAVTSTSIAAPTQAVAPTAPTAGSTSTQAAATSAPATGGNPTEEPEVAATPAQPGPAVNLTGDATRGAQVFATNCVACHGPQGKGGVANPGSSDGSVPPLNPIDPQIANKDVNVFTTNVDLFVEHGSTPEGPNPTLKMPAWGDSKALSPQQIADVLAYIVSLNQGSK
jgi:mono/diheme cytochrome c family protein